MAGARVARAQVGAGKTDRATTFGRTCSAGTFGHGGSTGTLTWHDAATATTFVLLTTTPATASRATLLLPVSDTIGRASA